MSRMKLTESETHELHKSVVSEIERMESAFDECGQLINSFKEKFNICETAYKIVLTEHQTRKGKTVDLEKLKLQMTQVPYALEFGGYEFEREMLARLFGSKRQYGWTAKAIRDALTHGVDAKALDELIGRQDELFVLMDSFVEAMCESL